MMDFNQHFTKNLNAFFFIHEHVSWEHDCFGYRKSFFDNSCEHLKEISLPSIILYRIVHNLYWPQDKDIPKATNFGATIILM